MWRVPWYAVIAMGVLTMSGCAVLGPESHIPPFARVPYASFSRAAVVAVALREWRLFGQKEGDEPGPGKPERDEGLWQRVGEYWWIGQDPDAREVSWTGKHDETGTIFSATEDGNYAWSAAFISYVMRVAGAGSRFPYAPNHSTYINIAAAHASNALQAYPPQTYAPMPGDLICHGRGRAAALRYDDLPTEALFPAHCDIVVDIARPGMIGVIGGNIGDAVTLRHVPVTASGRLAGPDGVVLDQRQTWMAVLRVVEGG